MNKKTIMTGLCLVIAFQLLVLVAEYGNSVYPLLTGKEIKLKTIPVDPRSLFRGNYARLNYDISLINGMDLYKTTFLRNGETVYVKLTPDADGFHVYDGISLKPPDEGLFIRGRIQASGLSGRRFRVMYGIEAWFAPKEKALALEKRFRTKGAATIMIAKNGKAALKDIGELK